MTELIETGKNGRFQPGNKAAVGHSTRAQKLRAAVLSAITRDDIREITEGLIEQAKDGDMDAIKVVLGYIGKPTNSPMVAVQVNQSNAPSDTVDGNEDRVGRALRIARKIQEEREAGLRPIPEKDGGAAARRLLAKFAAEGRASGEAAEND